MSTKYHDYYQTLGVSRAATQDEIQRAFRKLAREFHPDLNKAPDAEKRFKEINEANEVLGDPEKRKRFDALGENWKAGQEFRPPWGGGGGGGRAGAGGAGAGGRRVHVDFGGMGGGPGGSHADFSDFFESLFGGGRGGMDMDDFAERVRSGGGGAAAGGRQRAATPRSSQGASHEAEITISLADAFHGGTRHVTLESRDDNGATTSRSYDVRIPPGITDGSTIRLGGQGGPGAGGGAAGDLLLRIRFAPDPRFRVDGAAGHDLSTTLPIAPWEAALGAKVPVQTLDDEIVVTIPPGSQSGQQLRIRGKGLPKKSGDHGDLFAELRVVVPRTLTPEEQALFEQLARASNFDPRRP